MHAGEAAVCQSERSICKSNDYADLSRPANLGNTWPPPIFQPCGTTCAQTYRGEDAFQRRFGADDSHRLPFLHFSLDELCCLDVKDNTENVHPQPLHQSLYSSIIQHMNDSFGGVSLHIMLPARSNYRRLPRRLFHLWPWIAF